MEKVERWLTLLLALGVVCLLSSGGVSESMIPFGDSEHYVMRGTGEQ